MTWSRPEPAVSSWTYLPTAMELTVVAVAPDLGERCLETIHQANWVQDLYGDDVLDTEASATAESVSGDTAGTYL
ncbi:hypothetical protein [Streptomyces brasiliensis]|uniref:Uncharacterized protein n=1 Tax=Streptomyces brasiliensis TaxID=1954 RepID=A0A917NEW3_9ACTN|nr:hypothetical protein GCM10010121_000570 [Streptomyces brasiliensis]